MSGKLYRFGLLGLLRHALDQLRAYAQELDRDYAEEVQTRWCGAQQAQGSDAKPGLPQSQDGR